MTADQTWTGTSMGSADTFRFHIIAPESVTNVENIQGGVLLTMRTSVWGYDRPEEFADRESRRNRMGDGEALYYRIRFYNNNAVRVELFDTSSLLSEKEERFLVDAKLSDDIISSDDDDYLTIDFNEYTLVVDKGTREKYNFRFRILNNRTGDNSFEQENQEDGLILFNYPPGKMLDNATGRSWFRECITLLPDEHIYGFGEKFNDLDKRGRDIRLWHGDAAGCIRDVTYKNIPFFLSSRGYGCFVNTSAASRFEVGSYDVSSIGVDVFDDCVDYFILPAPSMQESLRNYIKLTGQPTLPPRWSFGLWMSKCTYLSEEELDEVVQKFKEYDLPLTTLHIDTGWFHEKWLCDWKFSEDRFPHPEGMIRRYREDGLRVSLWQLPYVHEAEGELKPDTFINQAFVEAAAGGYFATDDNGEIYGMAGKPKNIPAEGVIDFSNPEARTWYQNKIRALLKMGVSAIKTDFGENAPSKAKYHGIDGAHMHNLYPKFYNEAVWEVFKEGFEQDPITWARSATVGCQTMPVHWGGDPSALWPHLAGSLWGGLSFGMSGGIFWSCDIGGFGGGRQPDEELYIRWAQFGTFNSHTRVHGNMEREPWKFGQKAVEVFRKFMKLRYRLLPYLLTEAKHCVETGRPMMCAMPLAFQDDPVCLSVQDQYMFGRSLMIAPVLVPGGKRNVYLPDGTWFDFWTKEKICGGRYIEVECPLESYPIFVRDGSIIPMVSESNRLHDEWMTDLTAEVYADHVTPASYTVADSTPIEIIHEDGRCRIHSGH